MSQRRLWIATAIIALVIIAGFLFSVPRTREVAQAPLAQNTTIVPSVTLRDTFSKGTHTITGSVEVPNACTVVTASAILEGSASSTESILVALSMPTDTGVCLEMPTRVNFGATVVAPALVPITATVNGSVASTTSS